jgi:hypothetical protein
MKTLRGSTTIESPNSKSPAVSHVQSVETSLRSSSARSVSARREISAATKERPTEAVAR